MEKIREFTLDGISAMSCWDIYGDTVYAVEQSTVLREGAYVNRVLLYSADINTGETSEIFEFKTLSSVKKIKVIDNKLYWLGQKDSYDPFPIRFTLTAEKLLTMPMMGKSSAVMI